MQDAGFWNPPVQERNQAFPTYPGALAAANQNIVPQPIQPPLEEAQLIDVSGDSVILVVALNDLLKPCTDVGCAIVLSALKLDLNVLKLRTHSLLRSDSPDGEGSALVALPTVMGKAQEREGLRFPRSTLLSVSGCIAPELDQPCLVRM